MPSHFENPATTKRLSFAESGSDIDRLWTAWTAADERARRVFLEQVRAEFLGAAQKDRRQAEPDGQRKQGVA